MTYKVVGNAKTIGPCLEFLHTFHDSPREENEYMDDLEEGECGARMNEECKKVFAKQPKGGTFMDRWAQCRSQDTSRLVICHY